jgi:tRNA dimethylallyltransferase
MPAFNCIVITGPTASGKTRLAAQLAAGLHTAIISVDSRQLYRDMNIGTGKDYEDYVVKGETVKAHLIDLVPAGSHYHIHQYLHDFKHVFEELSSKGMIPVLCGGSPLYLQAVLKGFSFTYIPPDEALRESLKGLDKESLLSCFARLPHTAYTSLADLSTSKRIIRAIEISSYLMVNEHQPLSYPLLKPLAFGLCASREIQRERIRQRLEQRLKTGLVEEVEQLLASGLAAEKLRAYGLEYKFVLQFIEKKISMQELSEQLTIAIQQFAKRQMTWFRKMEREGLKIHWIDVELPVEDQLEKVKEIIVQHS